MRSSPRCRARMLLRSEPDERVHAHACCLFERGECHYQMMRERVVRVVSG